MSNVAGSGGGYSYTPPAKTQRDYLSGLTGSEASGLAGNAGLSFTGRTVAPTPTAPAAAPYAPLATPAGLPTPTSWLGQVGAIANTKTPVPVISQGNRPEYGFMGGGAIAAGTGEIAQGDWGMNGAAQAQVALLQDAIRRNVQQSQEQEAARGMYNSGIALAVGSERDRMGQLDAANVMAQAAAEQGRLNQQVAIASANNQLAREQSNQGALLTQDQIRSGYDTTMRDLILNASKANAANNLAYLGFDENARQFNQTLAQQQTQANRDYQMGRLGYNQKDQQYYAGLNQDASQFGQTLAEQQAKRQQDAVLQALGYQYQYGDLGAKGSATGPASEFVKDLPNLMAAIADEASAGPVNASKWIAIMRAQYPGVDPMSYPQVVDLLDRAAMASGLPGAFAPPTGK